MTKKKKVRTTSTGATKGKKKSGKVRRNHARRERARRAGKK